MKQKETKLTKAGATGAVLPRTGFVFEQQPRESDKAFAAFSLYLGLGPQRSLAAVARKLAKSEQLIKRWSTNYDWPVRVQAHAAHLAVAEREAAEALARAKGVDWVKRQEEHREKEWEIRCRLMKLAETAIERWLAKPERCGSLEGIARLLDLASRLGRLASGLPTDSTEIVGDAERPVRVEVVMALEKIYGEPLPGEVVETQVVSDMSAHECHKLGNGKGDGGDQKDLRDGKDGAGDRGEGK